MHEEYLQNRHFILKTQTLEAQIFWSAPHVDRDETYDSYDYSLDTGAGEGEGWRLYCTVV